jgi:hypothetical protein
MWRGCSFRTKSRDVDVGVALPDSVTSHAVGGTTAAPRYKGVA